ncbi:MAG: hypothetical protein M1824_001929 [Vezdaea acicularis]|nr:MAG: hypothetical protein M1824_001929 [Vezdaea acicularis]
MSTVTSEERFREIFQRTLASKDVSKQRKFVNKGELLEAVKATLSFKVDIALERECHQQAEDEGYLELVDEGLHNKRARILMEQRGYCPPENIITNANDNGLPDVYLRHWAFKSFVLKELPGFGSSLVWRANYDKDDITKLKNANDPEAPYVCQEDLYGAIAQGHINSGHRGRDGTCQFVGRIRSGVPKELVGKFVAECPTCTAKRPAQKRTASQAFSSLDGGYDLLQSDSSLPPPTPPSTPPTDHPAKKARKNAGAAGGRRRVSPLARCMQQTEQTEQTEQAQQTQPSFFPAAGDFDGPPFPRQQTWQTQQSFFSAADDLSGPPLPRQQARHMHSALFLPGWQLRQQQRQQETSSFTEEVDGPSHPEQQEQQSFLLPENSGDLPFPQQLAQEEELPLPFDLDWEQQEQEEILRLLGDLGDLPHPPRQEQPTICPANIMGDLIHSQPPRQQPRQQQRQQENESQPRAADDLNGLSFIAMEDRTYPQPPRQQHEQGNESQFPIAGDLSDLSFLAMEEPFFCLPDPPHTEDAAYNFNFEGHIQSLLQ